MNLTFNLNEPEALALTELFYKDSPSHQQIRNRTRWVLPIFLVPIVILFTLQFGFSLPSILVFAIAIVGWIIIAPKRFDVRIRRYAQNLMKESSYGKSFGEYTIQINDGHLLALLFAVIWTGFITLYIVGQLMDFRRGVVVDGLLAIDFFFTMYLMRLMVHFLWNTAKVNYWISMSKD